jgi:hypothetical protein
MRFTRRRVAIIRRILAQSRFSKRLARANYQLDQHERNRETVLLISPCLVAAAPDDARRGPKTQMSCMSRTKGTTASGDFRPYLVTFRPHMLRTGTGTAQMIP